MRSSSDDDINALKAGQIDHIGVRLWHAQKAFFREMMKRLSEQGYADLTPANTILLPYLDIEGTRMTTLAKRAGLSKQAVGQTIKELQRLGYVTVEDDPDDKRAKMVCYSERGRRYIRAGQQIKAQLQAELTAHLGDAEMNALMADLARLADYWSSS